MMVINLTYRECLQLRLAADKMIKEFKNMEREPPKPLITALEKLRDKKPQH